MARANTTSTPSDLLSMLATSTPRRESNGFIGWTADKSAGVVRAASRLGGAVSASFDNAAQFYELESTVQSYRSNQKLYDSIVASANKLGVSPEELTAAIVARRG